MIRSVTFSLKHLLLLRISMTVVALPTLGYLDLNRLESYEDLSEEPRDFDLFENLTFRFSCEGKPTGLYADPDYACRIFHACDDSGNGFPVLCPNGTAFDQKERVCSDEEHADCDRADEWFHLNELPSSMDTTEGNRVETMETEEGIPTVLPLLPS